MICKILQNLTNALNVEDHYLLKLHYKKKKKRVSTGSSSSSSSSRSLFFFLLLFLRLLLRLDFFLSFVAGPREDGRSMMLMKEARLLFAVSAPSNDVDEGVAAPGSISSSARLLVNGVLL